jgi:hypothetical protein
MLKNVAQKLIGRLLGAAVVLACAGQAQAVQFIGEWDPAFDPSSPFAGYSWAGKVQVDVPKSCFSASTTLVTALTCPSMVLDFGLVSIITSSNTLATQINFAGGPPSSLLAVNFSGGAPQSVRAGNFNQLVSTGWYAPGVNPAFATPVCWGLSFINSLPVLSWQYIVCEVEGDCNHARINDLGLLDCDFVTGQTTRYASNQYAPVWSPDGFMQVGLQVVPEPASLALLIPAIGMLAGFRRRRTTAAAN